MMTTMMMTTRNEEYSVTPHKSSPPVDFLPSMNFHPRTCQYYPQSVHRRGHDLPWQAKSSPPPLIDVRDNDPWHVHHVRWYMCVEPNRLAFRGHVHCDILVWPRPCSQCPVRWIWRWHRQHCRGSRKWRPRRVAFR